MSASKHMTAAATTASSRARSRLGRKVPCRAVPALVPAPVPGPVRSIVPALAPGLFRVLACGFVSALFLACLPSPAAEPEISAVTAAVKAHVDRGEVAGAVTAVADLDRVLHASAVGQADVAGKVPLRGDALFWIASMTKPVTAVAVLMLQDEGKLSVDDPVAKHLPELAGLKTAGGKPAAVTLKHLLTHTSGMGDASPAARLAARSLADLIPQYAAQPLRFEPGTRWEYCQSSINTLARVIEVASGQSFPDFLQGRLFDPLGMKDTSFYPSEAQLERLAKSYRAVEGRLEEAPLPPEYDARRGGRFPAANGGLYSTAGDYARFCQMLLGQGSLGGRRYLSAAAVARMSSIQTGDLATGFTEGNGWGLGCCVVRKPQGATGALSPGSFGHGGAYGTQAWIDPEKKVIYVLMVQRANFPNADASDLRRDFQGAAAAFLQGGAGAWRVGTPIVTYWCGPPVTDAVAAQMVEGGFNLVWCAESELDLVARHGLRAHLTDGLLSPASLDTPDGTGKLDALIDRVRRHPALYSYHIVDEPSAAQFPALGKLVAHIRERDPAHLAYINLFPTYASNEQLGTSGDVVTAYREHLRRYVDVVRPSLLSYDHYQFMVAGETKQYFLNLSLIRRAALDAGVPFLNIVQASSWAPNVRVPNSDELRYLVYTTAAYGAQGISYYIYCCPNHAGGIAAPDGTPTPLYGALKGYNREFVAIAKELASLRSLGVQHTALEEPGCEPIPADAAFRIVGPTGPSGTSGTPDRPSTPEKQGTPDTPGTPRQAAGRGFLLGLFGADERPTHLVAVSLDHGAEAVATVVGPGALESFDAASGKWSGSGGPEMELRFPPGGGRLLRLAGSASQKDRAEK